MLPTVEESRGYDFQDPENAEKWRGLIVTHLRKVLEQVHPSLSAEESALQYVESLCLRLLAMLCAVPSPLTVQDVEERVHRTFPSPLERWALTEARDAAHSKRRRPLLPLDRIHTMLQKEVLLYKIDMSVSVVITAILEYVCADILKLAGNFVKKISHKSGYDVITCRDIKTAMCADKVLMDMFYQDSELAVAVSGSSGTGPELTYSELVRDLMTDEKHFLRELHLIIRVFKDELEKIAESTDSMPPDAISLIFGNIVDIYELTVTLLGNLEDACEVAQDSSTPYIGSCFEELAEVEEFKAYARYANIVTKAESREALQSIVDDHKLSERLDTAGHGFRLAVKYYLPRLLLAPVGHVFLYHKYVLQLMVLAPHTEDRESFKQVECNLQPIKKLLVNALGNGPKMDATLRMASRARRQLAIEKCNELSRIVDNWDSRDMAQCCGEFFREDTLSKIGPGKRVAERRAYLFDGLLLLCKPVTSLVGVNMVSTNGANSGPAQLKLKEKLHIRKVELVDRGDDGDEGRHLVELWPRVGPPVVLAAASSAEKRNWMCDLVMLNTKPMLDRSLDSILLDLERRHPLQLPPPTLYRFAVPDSPDNIVLEDRQRGSGTPLIKGATLLKLVERLTYHIYADLVLVRTFLTTYRSFCSPQHLLGLLVERFNVPEPGQVYDTRPDNSELYIAAEGFSPVLFALMHAFVRERRNETMEPSVGSDAEKLSKNTAREDWKRYRKEFQQPVKFRVINVLRHWVDQHFYDFERDPDLLEKLRSFLESVDGRPMKKWVQSVLKTIQRKSQEADALNTTGGPSPVFDRLPPATLRHVCDPARVNWHPLALHPLELARQLTLWEFQLYRQVKPSELVGAVWTKKDKERTSPNLLRIIKHTTNFTRWMEKWVVESENLEERVGVVIRLVELACGLSDLNNFNGVLCVVAACGSASVHRLRQTFNLLPPRLSRALDEFRELNSDHFRRYQERLRSINPPCVPFFGMYLTNILHIEEGNLDFLPNSELINFSKRRKVAEITGEIQQYQNQPYCLTVEPRTRAFLETLDPFPNMDDNQITNYLYAKSLEIEPRPPVKQMPKYPRKYPELSLKQVKVSRRHHDQPQVNNNNDAGTSQLSPTSTWDSLSVSSFSSFSSTFTSFSEDHKSTFGGASPRLERSGSTTFPPLSLLDKGLALFDKTKTTGRGTRDEPPSPRDRHSPRHDRQTPSYTGTGTGTGERKALSPRGAIVDAELFYSARSELPRKQEVDPERERETDLSEVVPPLLPRHADCDGGGPPPRLPRRDHANSSWSPPSPPERPLPSPKPIDHNRASGMSPKRSPAPPLPSPRPPPAPNSGGPTCAVFSFPQGLQPSPPPPHASRDAQTTGNGPPPPLPPRRRRDSSAPMTPVAQPGSSATVRGGGGVTPPPPPLPPRPSPAPALLRPAHSALLQRRHHTAIGGHPAPRLPPKPAVGAGGGGARP